MYIILKRYLIYTYNLKKSNNQDMHASKVTNNECFFQFKNIYIYIYLIRLLCCCMMTQIVVHWPRPILQPWNMSLLATQRLANRKPLNVRLVTDYTTATTTLSYRQFWSVRLLASGLCLQDVKTKVSHHFHSSTNPLVVLSTHISNNYLINQTILLFIYPSIHYGIYNICYPSMFEFNNNQAEKIFAVFCSLF